MIPKILIGWEFGANLGHLSKVVELARALQHRADLVFATPAPDVAAAYAPDIRWQVRAAPKVVFTPITDAAGAISYPDDIRACGWQSADILGSRLDGWEALIDDVSPDIIVAQAAPTLLLAARGRAVRTVMFGSGYDTPPRSVPMPLFLHWQSADADHVEAARREGMVVDVMNTVLRQRSMPVVSAFADLLATDKYLLATWPEIDHYHPRARFEPDPVYRGQLMTIDRGLDVAWKAGASARIFAYLRAGSMVLPSVVTALVQLGPEMDVILAVPGAPPEIQDRVDGTHVRLFQEAVRLDRLLPDCDLGLSHASNGVAAAFMTHGVPQIGFPGQIEQLMVGHTITVTGSGLSASSVPAPKLVRDSIGHVLSTPIFRKNAETLRAKYGHRSVGGIASDLAMEILTLI